jgi:DNA-binding MarR family transcriptional regulator
MRKIDQHMLTVRDVLVLYTVMTNPGIMGLEVAHKLGLENRSSVISNINRLIREGMIEDRRQKARRANPAMLHVLPRGIEFWNEIKP